MPYYSTTVTTNPAAKDLDQGGNGHRGLLSSTGPSYRATVLLDSPDAFYRLGESVGATVAATEVGAITGTIPGAPNAPLLEQTGLVVGDANTSALFDGIDDYVSLGDNFRYAGTAPFTVETLVSPSGFGQTRVIASAMAAPSGTRSRQSIGSHVLGSSAAVSTGGGGGWEFGCTNTQFYCSRTDSSGGTDTAIAPLLVIGNDTHVAATYDGATITLWVDGTPVGVVASTRSVPNVAVAAYIGNSAGLAKPWAGIADEVAFYPAALSSSRIAAHANAAFPAASWLPLPPASYTPTGTVTTSVVDPGPLGGVAEGYSLFWANCQRVCQNANGIFVAYGSYIDDTPVAQEWWKLKWSASTDAGGGYDGVSWSTVYDSQAAGQASCTWSVALETDNNNNVYVFSSHYNQPGKEWRMYKFLAPSYTLAAGYPKILQIPPGGPTLAAAGKYAVYWDQGRQWFWIMVWANFLNSPNLGAVDTDGVSQYSKNFFDTSASAAHATAHYPQLAVARDGTIFCSWITAAASRIANGTTLPINAYYDVHMIYSTDNGVTWIGAASTPGNPVPITTFPVIQDDGGPLNRSGFEIINVTDPNEFISATSPNYGSGGSFKYDTNEVPNTTYNNGALHFYYHSNGTSNPALHNVYARFNVSDNRIEQRNTPRWRAPRSETDPTLVEMNFGGAGGFVADTTQAGRIYYVSDGTPAQANSNKVLAFRSDNNGVNWYQYALATTALPANFRYTNICRWVQSDGSLIGVTHIDSDKSIRFFRIKPN